MKNLHAIEVETSSASGPQHNLHSLIESTYKSKPEESDYLYDSPKLLDCPNAADAHARIQILKPH